MISKELRKEIEGFVSEKLGGAQFFIAYETEEAMDAIESNDMDQLFMVQAGLTTSIGTMKYLLSKLAMLGHKDKFKEVKDEFIDVLKRADFQLQEEKFNQD